MNQKTTFTAGNSTLEVISRDTKKSGTSVFTRLKTGKGKGSPKAQVGNRSLHKDAPEAAQAAFDGLVAQVTAKGGWTLGASRSGGASSFTGIPDAPAATEAPAAPPASPASGSARNRKGQTS